MKKLIGLFMVSIFLISNAALPFVFAADGVSVTIEAESKTGINAGTAKDVSGGIQLMLGSSCCYEVTIPADGIYQMTVYAYPYKSEGADSVLQLIENDYVLSSVTVPGRTGASEFVSYEADGTFELSEGVHSFVFGAPAGGYGCYVDRFVLQRKEDAAQDPNEPIKLEAENYQSSDNGSGGEVKKTSAGIISFLKNSWVTYRFLAGTEGLYRLTAYASSADPIGSCSMTASVDDEVQCTGEVGVNGDWNIYVNNTLGVLSLTKGVHTLRIATATDTRACQIDYFLLERIGDLPNPDADKIEAEASDISPSRTVAVGDDGTAVVLGGGESLSYTVRNQDVRAVKVRMQVKTEGGATVSLYADGQMLGSKTLAAGTEYELLPLWNLRMFSGDTVLIFRVDSGEIVWDWFSLSEPDISETESSADSLKVEAEAFKTDGSTGVSNRGGYVQFSYMGNAVYEVNIPKTGTWCMSVSAYPYKGAGEGDSDVRLYENNELLASIAVEGGSAENFITYAATQKFELTEGWHTFSFGTPDGYGCYVDFFTLEYVGNTLEVYAAYADDVLLANDTEVGCGCDTLRIYLTGSPAADSVSAETVQLFCDGTAVPLYAHAENKTIFIQLRQSLEAGKTYTPVLNGVESAFNSQIITETMPSFLAIDSQTGKASVSADNPVVDYNGVTICGTMYSSQSVGIKGRLVTLTLTAPDGAVISDCAAAYSGENGSYTLQYRFSASDAVGTYRAVISGDFVETPCEQSFLYITQSTEEDILSAMELTSVISDVRRTLLQYADILSLSVLTDLDMLSDEDVFLEYFIGGRFENVQKLCEFYHRTLVMERLNQTRNAVITESILSDMANAQAVGLDSDEISLAVKNRESLFAELAALPAIRDVETFAATYQNIIRKWVAQEYGKNPTDIILTDYSVYYGSGISIPLTFSAAVTHLCSADLKLECDESLLETIELQVTDGFAATYETEGNILTIHFLAETLAESVTSLGTIVLTAGSVGDYEIHLCGTLVYDEDLACKLYSDLRPTDGKCNVTVKSTGGGGSSSGGASSSGGSNIKSSASGMISTGIKESFSFTDLANVSWAQESINALLKNGILSESESGQFEPMRSVTREEFVKMIVCAMKLDLVYETVHFTDCEENAWYLPYVATACRYGIVFGRDNGCFGIGEQITREDMAVILYRTLNRLGVSAATTAEYDDDSHISDYAREAVYTVKHLGLMSGTGDNRFEPMSTATRAMAAKVVYEIGSVK